MRYRPFLYIPSETNRKGGAAIRVYRMDEKCLKCSNVTQEIEEVERVFSGLKSSVFKGLRLDIETHREKGTNDSELGFVAALWQHDSETAV